MGSWEWVGLYADIAKASWIEREEQREQDEGRSSEQGSSIVADIKTNFLAHCCSVGIML